MKLRLGAGVCVEVLRTSPVKTTGVQTPDLAGCPQDDKRLGGSVKFAAEIWVWRRGLHRKSGSFASALKMVSGVFCGASFFGGWRRWRRVRGVFWRPSWVWWIGDRGLYRGRRGGHFR